MSICQKCVAMMFAIALISPAYGQARDIEEMSATEIRSELDQLLADEFNRTTEWDRVEAALIRLTGMFRRRPEAAMAQIDISHSELETLQFVFMSWGDSTDRDGDNRIARMCDVWNASNFTGSERIDAALLASEREISTGYADFTQRKVEQLLVELERLLLPVSWQRLSEYIAEQSSLPSDNVSHSFFTNTARASQSVEALELHCGR